MAMAHASYAAELARTDPALPIVVPTVLVPAHAEPGASVAPPGASVAPGVSEALWEELSKLPEPYGYPWTDEQHDQFGDGRRCIWWLLGKFPDKLCLRYLKDPNGCPGNCGFGTGHIAAARTLFRSPENVCRLGRSGGCCKLLGRACPCYHGEAEYQGQHQGGRGGGQHQGRGQHRGGRGQQGRGWGGQHQGRGQQPGRGQQGRGWGGQQALQPAIAAPPAAMAVVPFEPLWYGRRGNEHVQSWRLHVEEFVPEQLFDRLYCGLRHKGSELPTDRWLKEHAEELLREDGDSWEGYPYGNGGYHTFLNRLIKQIQPFRAELGEKPYPCYPAEYECSSIETFLAEPLEEGVSMRVALEGKLSQAAMRALYYPDTEYPQDSQGQLLRLEPKGEEFWRTEAAKALHQPGSQLFRYPYGNALYGVYWYIRWFDVQNRLVTSLSSPKPDDEVEDPMEE